MMDEGYEEGRAIPIATSQAKEWKKILRAGFFHYSGLISAFRFVIVFHQLIDFFFRSVFLDEGYEEGRAIPIATSQAKEWKKNASKEEIDQLMTFFITLIHHRIRDFNRFFLHRFLEILQ
jgi:hypothetical protein